MANFSIIKTLPLIFIIHIYKQHVVGTQAAQKSRLANGNVESDTEAAARIADLQVALEQQVS